MTVGPSPAGARHAVENLLTGYLLAVDAHDLTGVLDALGEAEVDVGGGPIRGRPELARAYRRAFDTGGSTRHVLFACRLDGDEDGLGVRARAPYQRWSLDEAPPRLTALGAYSATFRVARTALPAGTASGEPDLVLHSLVVTRDWQAG